MTKFTRRQLAEIWDQLNQKHAKQKAVKLFAELIFQQRKTREIKYIIDTIHRLEFEKAGLASISLRTARSVTPLILDEIAKAIKKIINAKIIKINHVTDSKLLGGFIAQSNDLFVDASIRRQVVKLEEL